MKEVKWEGKDVDGNEISVKVAGGSMFSLTDEFFTKHPEHQVLVGKGRVEMYYKGDLKTTMSYDIVKAMYEAIKQNELDGHTKSFELVAAGGENG